jgi:hypothetical protein
VVPRALGASARGRVGVKVVRRARRRSWAEVGCANGGRVAVPSPRACAIRLRGVESYGDRVSGGGDEPRDSGVVLLPDVAVGYLGAGRGSERDVAAVSLIALAWENVDPAAGVVSVRRQLDERGRSRRASTS